MRSVAYNIWSLQFRANDSMLEVLMQLGFSSLPGSECFGEDLQYTARPILVTRSSFAGVVFVRPTGLVTLELQTLNW